MSDSRILVGEMTYIGPNCFLGAHRHPLKIGRDCMIGARCYLITANHETCAKPYREQGFRGADVVIGDNVWLGCGVVVLPGVNIGDNAVVGAGAVVTKDVPAGETWAGIPARAISSVNRSQT
ncbi:acyltransferase [Haloferula chungangensis]|uniref:Acyltransferase n=1 Tax=Haloferula chungangensis TaxID=1048331 RepID=A0ABW2L9U7_9BACT